jgi:hypothetical protein
MNAKEALEAPSTLEAMFPYREMLERALEFAGGTHLFEDIVQAVDEGRMHFWPAEKSCVVTEVVCYPRARAIHIFLAAGDLMEIKDMDETFQEFGRALDAKFITLSGRKGWVKALDDLGYSVSHVSLYKEIEDGRK